MALSLQQLRDGLYAAVGSPTTGKDKATADAVKAIADQLLGLTLAPPAPPPHVYPATPDPRSGHERRKIW